MKGRPPGTLTELQSQQKQESRQKIVAAADALFAQRSYIGTSIEDIAREAGISRVTFYKHFKSKLDVAVGILDRYASKMIDDYGSLGRIADPDTAQIAIWIKHILALWRSQKNSMDTLASLVRQDPQIGARRTQTYTHTIARLGEGIPAFALAASGTDEEAHVRAHLLLIELEDLCYELVISEWPVNEDMAVNVVAGHFRDFIASVRDPA